MHLVRPLPMTTRAVPVGVHVRRMGVDDLDAVARVHLAAYAPGLGVANLDEAVAETRAVLGGDYGAVVPDATLVATDAAGAVGCIQTVLDPPWDAPSGPFVIDLFVRPDARRRGIGEGLLGVAADALWASGHVSVGMTVEPLAAMAAFRIYQRLGFRALG